MMCYEQIELKEGEPVVFLGVHALRWNWQEWGEPKVGFIDCDCNQKVASLQAENAALRDAPYRKALERMEKLLGKLHEPNGLECLLLKICREALKESDK